MKPPIGPLLLLGLFAFLFLANLDRPGLFDADEGAYAEVSRVMYTSGDYLVPRINGEDFFHKPPFLYWTEALGFHLFGVGHLGVRVFNALAAVGLILAVYAFSLRPLGARGAFLAALSLGTSLLVIIFARVTLTDMWLTLWLTLCLGALHRAMEAAREGRGGLGWFLGACLFSAAATLTKGAIGMVLPGAAALLHVLVHRQGRVVFRPSWLIPGLFILFGVGFSWYILLGLTHEGGFSFMKELFLEHHVGRFTQPMEGHRGQIFYYVIVLFVGFWPWSPFLYLMLRRGQLRGDDERARFLHLLLLFSGVAFLLFSLAATKLPGYIAPVLPTLAILIGNLWERQRESGEWGKAWTTATGLAAASLLLLAGALIASPAVLAALPGWLGEKALQVPALAEPIELGVMPYVGTAILAVGAFFVARGGYRREPDAVAWSLVITLCAMTAFASFQAIPLYDRHFSAPLQTASRLAAAETQTGSEVLVVGISHARSILFYSRRLTRYVDPGLADEVCATSEGGAPRVGITVEAYIDRFQGPAEIDILGRSRGYVVFRCTPTRSVTLSGTTFRG